MERGLQICGCAGFILGRFGCSGKEGAVVIIHNYPVLIQKEIAKSKGVTWESIQGKGRERKEEV